MPLEIIFLMVLIKLGTIYEGIIWSLKLRSMLSLKRIRLVYNLNETIN